ncbi:MAG TPA: hypothetical protein VGQ80_16195, partial [Acidimicrobiia bacterium]|nr:hypothetical protein [Acidimicrobiia bacterium]
MLSRAPIGLLCVTVLGAVLTVLPPGPAGAATATVTVAPDGDATVAQATATTAMGSDPTLQVDQ